MISSVMQLKDKIRNMSDGNSNKTQTLLRNYMMERFLERISLSPYKDKFILKGGMLVSAVVGVNYRSTMDIDTTVNAITLNLDNATRIINEIISIDLSDGVSFVIKSSSDIMEEFDYSGLRFMLEASFDGIKQAIKIDISTGDVITPSAIMRDYKLMFEDRIITIKSYNIETLIAEKIETIMSRGSANTRMRDFYDVYQIWNLENQKLNKNYLTKAFYQTSLKRNTFDLFENVDKILDNVLNDQTMKRNWDNYSLSTYYVGDLSWDEVNKTIHIIFDEIKKSLQ